MCMCVRVRGVWGEVGEKRAHEGGDAEREREWDGWREKAVFFC